MSNKDDDFTYDRSFKTTTGVGALLSNLKKRSQEFADKPNSTTPVVDANYLRACCDTGAKGPPIRKFAKIKSYTCEICDIDCTSESVYEQHIKGSKHAKKARNLGLIQGSNVSTSSDATGKNLLKCLNLREELAKTNEPVIALRYIEEVIPETNSVDFEPMYNCTLCNISNVGSVPMLSHIVGSKHRSKYIELRFHRKVINKSDLLTDAAQIQRQEGSDVNVIQKIFSDSKYPFPPGKIPDGSNQTEKESLSSSPVGRLLDDIANCSVKKPEDAELAFSVSSKLISALVDYKSQDLQSVDTKKLVNTCGDTILRNLRIIFDIQSEATVPAKRARKEESEMFFRRSPTLDESYENASYDRRSTSRDYDDTYGASQYSDGYSRNYDSYSSPSVFSRRGYH